jgi:hypothetical protein
VDSPETFGYTLVSAPNSHLIADSLVSFPFHIKDHNQEDNGTDSSFSSRNSYLFAPYVELQEPQEIKKEVVEY